MFILCSIQLLDSDFDSVWVRDFPWSLFVLGWCPGRPGVPLILVALLLLLQCLLLLLILLLINVKWPLKKHAYAHTQHVTHAHDTV